MIREGSQAKSHSRRDNRLISDGKTASFDRQIDVRKLAWQYGSMPLPPYIRRPADETDMERYQTVYASVEGSIEAPTAGLHFTSGLLDTIVAKGVLVRCLTLHVGIGIHLSKYLT
jgi:S-adenosylmethionine:tRNA ribosyltransferase-isomerase